MECIGLEQLAKKATAEHLQEKNHPYMQTDRQTDRQAGRQAGGRQADMQTDIRDIHYMTSHYVTLHYLTFRYVTYMVLKQQCKGQTTSQTAKLAEYFGTPPVFPTKPTGPTMPDTSSTSNTDDSVIAPDDDMTRKHLAGQASAGTHTGPSHVR